MILINSEVSVRYQCNQCGGIYLHHEIFACTGCDSWICDDCAKYFGKWLHMKEQCQYCLGSQSEDTHLIVYVCSTFCQRAIAATNEVDL